MNQSQIFTWTSTVKNEDIDFQNIVNNAVYLKYFEQARAHLLSSIGVDLQAWHENGFNIVLAHIDMSIRKSLKLHDDFIVKSTFHRQGRLRVIFNQTIHTLEHDTLIAEAVNTVACASISTAKPVMPDALAALLQAAIK